MTKKKNSAPRKSKPNKLTDQQREKIVEALVFGELIRDAENQLVTRYPTQKELADRYGVTPSAIRYIDKKYECSDQRRTEELRLQAAVRDEIIDQRAKVIAHDKTVQLETIDAWLNEFRVKTLRKSVVADQPLDYDRMLRLRHFVLGEADSRTETEIGITLRGLSERHRRYREVIDGVPVSRSVSLLPPAEPALPQDGACAPASLPQPIANTAHLDGAEVQTSEAPRRPTQPAPPDRKQGGPPPASLPIGFFDPETGIIPQGSKGRDRGGDDPPRGGNGGAPLVDPGAGPEGASGAREADDGGGGAGAAASVTPWGAVVETTGGGSR